ncbi:hypothetical protein [Asticcacaulis sp. AC466]|nr:hypothetical protein [Asticcacaulis sp. AC466]
MLHLIIELRLWLAAAAGLGLVTGFVAKRVMRPKKVRRVMFRSM